MIKQLGQTCLLSSTDRVMCTVVTDRATSSANASAAASPSGLSSRLHDLVKRTVSTYKIFAVDQVPVVGVGEVDLSVTFVTKENVDGTPITTELPDLQLGSCSTNPV
eukprot:TRINITY_DN6069_c0_g1_i2.p1 TRINITY_DN6069_c0_g1~~TRINITY_DN6069_c0_g1_i2.p1  ORF type:complete len:107 (+),score=26.64 TRINITY_DN6069_c0_g1_i2:163-483(+)